MDAVEHLLVALDLSRHQLLEPTGITVTDEHDTGLADHSVDAVLLPGDYDRRLGGPLLLVQHAEWHLAGARLPLVAGVGALLGAVGEHEHGSGDAEQRASDQAPEPIEAPRPPEDQAQRQPQQSDREPRSGQPVRQLRVDLMGDLERLADLPESVPVSGIVGVPLLLSQGLGLGLLLLGQGFGRLTPCHRCSVACVVVPGYPCYRSRTDAANPRARGVRVTIDQRPNSPPKSPPSSRALTADRKRAATAPSTRRWS